MYIEGSGRERERGPRPEELGIREDARSLHDAYAKNVEPILKDKSQQLGEVDREGHMHHAQQMLRILTTLQDTRIDPHEWPKNFELPGNIPVVFRDGEGNVRQKEINVRSFDNPKKFIDGVQDVFYGAGIA